MEAKDDPAIIGDSEFTALLNAARQQDPEAMLQLIELFKEDILRLSKVIYMPEEDVVSEIVLEFLEFVQQGKE
ncbi:helix-turn-helix domain-containing protein [Paenibacillus albidus]|uniref:helix-turn-helix domain-containing protein n=1 Tax=Paenibacillus albidus TaxID=2041023 RepID=UPI001BE6DC51|nr:helix-turn-helix domain-containing protein [Paenibacillus albidus]